MRKHKLVEMKNKMIEKIVNLSWTKKKQSLFGVLLSFSPIVTNCESEEVGTLFTAESEGKMSVGRSSTYENKQSAYTETDPDLKTMLYLEKKAGQKRNSKQGNKQSNNQADSANSSATLPTANLSYYSCPPHDCYTYKGPMYKGFTIYLAPHIIKNSAGETAVSVERVSKDINALNKTFNWASIFFQQKQNIKYIVSDTYWDLSINDEFEFLLDERMGKGVPMYYVKTISSGKYSGAAHMGKLDGIVLSGEDSQPSITVLHEIGHQLGLFHTHENDLCDNTFCTATTLKNSPFHCEKTGDFICDTSPDSFPPPCPVNYANSCSLKCPPLVHMCAPDTHNIMSYYGFCRTSFSEQQWRVMGCFLNQMVK